MADLSHMRVLEPHPGIIAYYDGRVEGYRFADGPNWVDDGALSVGIASYAIVQGDAALVYDSHVSVSHAAFIRADLAQRGVKTFTVVLSHWHLDHIAGTEAFAGSPVIANEKTFAHMSAHKAAIEAGRHHGAPAINPLIMPTQKFSGRLDFKLGSLDLQLLEMNIHSDDGTVIWIPSQGLLLAGDTLEDTVTYVVAPQDFNAHLTDLERLWALNPSFILPNHGDPEIIAAGGYDKGLIRATQQYVRVLKRCVVEPDLRKLPLAQLIAGPLERGWVHLYGPYEAVHRENVELTLKRRSQA
jgi:glyoxylase-like metal-dependent hydrolase (beta-lactamase superfamily II)